MQRIITAATVCCGVTLASCGGDADSPTDEYGGFRHRVIDESGPVDPWGKIAADLTGDGNPDLLVGGQSSRDLYVYRSPEWARDQIADGIAYSTGHAAADFDGDGLIDILSLSNEAVYIYQAPNWERSDVADLSLHDVLVADLDADGDVDAVGRNQSAFGGSGAEVYVFENRDGVLSLASSRPVPDGEGLLLARIGDDSLSDIVVNQIWLQNNGTIDVSSWPSHRYTDTWVWPHVKLDGSDIDGDGRTDLVAAPAEPAGNTYRISWFRQPADPTAIWRESIVADSLEAIHHSLFVAEINGDGAPDIVTAEMHQSVDPDNVSVYFNRSNGQEWPSVVIGTQGSHNLLGYDFDQDGDIDIVGSNWSGDYQPIEVWENQRCPAPTDRWKRRIIDADQSFDSLFVFAGDLDGDGWSDVIAGRWWYTNVRGGKGDWNRHSISEGTFHAASAIDYDGDGDIDLVGTGGLGIEPNSEVIVATNDGRGNFELRKVSNGVGDFLQGIAFIGGGKSVSVVLSWHAEGSSLQTAPLNEETPGTRNIASPDVAQQEAISVADLDADGAVDVLLGTRWLKAVGEDYEPMLIHETSDQPDRNVVTDIDGDGVLDVVIGYEAIDREGLVAWYRHGADPYALWQETQVGRFTGPMSLDAGDIDGDGDMDLVVGEHNLSAPDEARLIYLENADGDGGDWVSHVIHTGDEHHDGAQLVDLDADGDLDVISIGWSHSRVIFYENLSTNCD